MPKFRVSVEKRLYQTGVVEVTAKDADVAIKQVSDKINSGKLQTTDIRWSVPEYEDSSFGTTGDVD
jgi:hypothetical protein